MKKILGTLLLLITISTPSLSNWKVSSDKKYIEYNKGRMLITFSLGNDGYFKLIAPSLGSNNGFIEFELTSGNEKLNFVDRQLGYVDGTQKGFNVYIDNDKHFGYYDLLRVFRTNNRVILSARGKEYIIDCFNFNEVLKKLDPDFEKVSYEKFQNNLSWSSYYKLYKTETSSEFFIFELIASNAIRVISLNQRLLKEQKLIYEDYKEIEKVRNNHEPLNDKVKNKLIKIEEYLNYRKMTWHIFPKLGVN